ncbi:YhcH/YjgK/YiaL family protein [Paenibacillus alkaliterrae]|uniref:YhcH/YjgK/YiaL family protein n=1 Tax=Paenibacillus alkaliterrae TaxID=320909 RepID=UPI001F2FEBB2|nr:YhcH/YjgK/YiaL family protein [Paenibacillus alkaliterrae]MCF2940083.1 YhcH/YjgK/YiaL family protein [Paenibacillus alkaliterrae]
MIVGDMRQLAQEILLYPQAVRRALEYLISGGLADREPGRYELAAGGLMYALVQQIVTQPSNVHRLESHDTYLDIQYVVSGEERIDFIRLTDQLVVEEQDLAVRDIVYYARMENQESSLVLTQGQFAVFYPSDAHRPCCAVNEPGELKKIVIKIHKQLWNNQYD